MISPYVDYDLQYCRCLRGEKFCAHSTIFVGIAKFSIGFHAVLCYIRVMKNSPHLNFLHSFEAAARHLSFTEAARELNCTQAAVSSHVRSLEGFIGRPLFVRHSHSLSLTDVGKAYLQPVSNALQEIDVATRSLISHNHKREVVISCPFSLAGNWLPRVIKAFHLAHPDIDLTVHGTIWTDVEPRVSDISITLNHRDDAAPDAVKLWAENLSLVCAPGFLVNGKNLTDPVQLTQARLIHILGRADYWEKVATHFELGVLDLEGGCQANSSILALELAVEELGCLALPSSLIGPYLKRGLLHEPFVFDLESPWAYHITYRDKSTPSVQLFTKWLMQAAISLRDEI